MQQRLMQNKQFARKNMKLSSYLLRGLIRRASCGHAYIGSTVSRRGKSYSYYKCGARWNPSPNIEICDSHSLRAGVTEGSVFEMVKNFLKRLEGFETEMRRRIGLTGESKACLRRDLTVLGRQQRSEMDTEAPAFKMAARGAAGDQVYEQQVGLTHTKQRWVAEQNQRVETQLVDLEQYLYDPANIEHLRNRLATRFSSATEEDRRFILEAHDAQVIVQTDATWELELQVPREVLEPTASGTQIVECRPESNSAMNTEFAHFRPG